MQVKKSSLLLKTSFCFLVIILCNFSKVNAQMRQVYLDNFQANNELLKLSFYSSSEGYAGFDYWVGYTTDTGRTFTKKYITIGNVNYNGYSVNLTFGFGIAGVQAFSQNNLLVYGHYGLVPSILRSTDGGNTFTLIFHSQYDPFALSTGIADMIFPQSNTIGFAVDADRILKTTNQGLSWSVVRTDPGSYFTNLEAVDNNNVFALSTDYATNKLLKTTNAGASWQTVNLPVLPIGKMSYAHFLTATTGWLSMYDNNNDYSFYKTTNGGSSWTLQNDLVATPFRCGKMKFTDANTGYALTNLFTTYKTLNSGVTWEPLPRDNNYSYLGYGHNDLQVINSNQLWAGGGHGFLELSTNAGGTPIPKAYFKIDTAGLWNTNVVNLLNYSRNIYTYRWLLNGTQISTSYNSSYIHDVNRTADTISLIVFNGTISDTTVKYQYFYPPVKVFSFAPAIAGTGNTVTITGLNFSGAFSVTFGGVAASSFNVVSATSITAVVGPGASGYVKVLTPTGRDSLAGFTYLPPPAITSFTPVSATAGTTITITGTNFTGTTNVSFGGIAATSYIIVSATTITAVAPSGQSGSVSVITPGGSASLAGYIALPTILSFSPVQGTQGTVMTISGTSFTGATAVSIGTVNAQSFTINSSTSITAVVGTGASGSVLITKPGGSSTLPGFTWVNTPVITSFTPISGPVGTSVTITGTGFSIIPANNTVYFGAVKAVVTASTATTIIVTVPVHTTFEPITVTCNNLTGYSSIPFLVTFANGGSITASSFVNRTVINMGSSTGPKYINLGDLDGDGKSDLIITAYGSPNSNNGLHLYRNTSTISSVSFASPLVIGNLDYVASAVGDLDGDGKLDIAIITNTSISTFLNTSTVGNLTFTAGAVLPAVVSPNGISIGDLDGDGKADIAAAGATTNIFRNISNPGNIAFAPRVSYAAGGIRNIMIADLNGDGKPELISPDGLIYIFKNNCTKGIINFDITTTIPGYSHSFLAVGDMDGDGKTDIVSGDINGSKVAVIRNTSSLSVISFAPSVELVCTEVPSGIGVSDLDGDGKPDIAAGTYNFSTSVFKNTSSPGNISFAAKVNYTAGLYSTSNMTATGDIDGDGKNDVVQISETQRTIAIHLNEVNPSPFILSFNPVLGGTGTSVTITGNNFTGVTAVSFGGVPAASYVVNSSTSITAIVGTGGSGIVAVTNNYGTGTKAAFVFGNPPVISSISPAFAPIGASITITGNNFSPVAANNIIFFGEVKAIVTAASVTSLTATVPLSAGHQPVTVTVNNLTAYSPQNFSVTFPGGPAGFDASSFAARIDRSNGGNGTLSDMDGDGKPDLVMAYGLNNMVIARNTSTSGIISFASNLSFPSIGDSQGATTGDLDGDGKPDVVIFNYDSSSISVLRNTSTTGNISMGSPAKYYTGPSATRPSDAIIHDVDGDGKPDIIVANYYSQSLAVFRNLSTNGNIILDTRIDYSTPLGYPTGVVVRDLDGDGKPELIASVNGPSNVTTFLNTSVPGSISFALKTNFTAGNWPLGVTASDIDGDSKLDIVIPNINGTTVSVFRNLSTLGNLSLAASQNYSTLSGPRHASVTDMDGDGKPDIVAENTYSNQSFSIFKNISTPGNLAMQPRFDYSTGTYSGRSNLGDIDGDGVPDVVLYMQNGITAFFRNLLGGSAVTQVCANSNTSILSNISGTTYQWQQNTGSGFNDISNNATFSGTATATLQIINVPLSFNGYQYRCKVNTTSFSIVTTLNVSNPPTANAGPDTTICTGNSVQLQGSGGTTYSWSPVTGLSNPNIANPIATPALTTAYVLTVSNASNCTARDTVIVSVNPIATPSISISTPSNTVCSGSTVVFTAVATNGGATPVYQWQVNGINAGTNSNTFTTSSLLNADQVKCILTSNANCVTSNTATSNIITMVVNVSAPASVNISTPATVNCFGTIVTFTATPVNGGATPAYQWQVNGVNAGTNSNTLTTSSLTNNAQVKVILTSSLGCALPATATSNIISMTVTPLPIANAGNDVSICSGGSVQLQASGGATYSWAPAVGLSNPNIANPIASPAATTVYVVTVSNAINCFTKDSVVVSVNQPSAPAVNISTPNTNICLGSAATFTAAATNGGSNPSYQWQVNGTNAGTNSNTFTSASLINNSQVKVIMTSNSNCVTTPTATSNIITITVDQLATPLVSLSNRVFTVTNPDAAATYTWQVKINNVWGNVVPAATGITYTAPAGGEYRVKAVKGACTAYSSSQLTNRNVNTLNHPFGIYLYPNPNNGILNIDSIRLAQKWQTLDIIDVEGKVLLTFNIKNQTSVSLDISMLKAGAYFAQLKKIDGTYYTVEFVRL